MAERLLRLSDDDLGFALTALSAHVDFPTDVDVAARVGVLLERGRAAPVRGRLGRLLPSRPLRRALVVAAALVVLLAAAAVAGRLGVPGLKLIFGSEGTSATPLPTVTTPSTPPTRSELFIGRPTTLAAARRDAGLQVAVPHDPALGSPEVYLSPVPRGGRVTFVYPRVPGVPRDRFTGVAVLVTEFDGVLNPEYLQKFVPDGLHVRHVAVGPHDGYWIGGPPHRVVLVDRRGQPFEDSIRLAGPTLVFQRGSLTIRIEGRVPLRRAQEIARSVR
jgi:hypothetical protein